VIIEETAIIIKLKAILLNINFKEAHLLDEKSLVEIAQKNLTLQIKNNFEQINNKFFADNRALTDLKKLLELEDLGRVEIFDNSHNQGDGIVSAMAVFIDGIATPKNYRKYKLKTVFKNDDYGSMREVIRRRYSKVLNEKLTPPNLIIVDGGLGQVSVAVDELEKLGIVDIPIIGLAKNDKHITEYIVVGFTMEKLMLDKKSQAYFLLQRMQEEVHRFAINFHNNLNKKSLFASSLDGITGLGPKTKLKLMKQFVTIANMQQASDQDLAAAGVTKAVIPRLRKALEEK